MITCDNLTALRHNKNVKSVIVLTCLMAYYINTFVSYTINIYEVKLFEMDMEYNVLHAIILIL